MCVIKSLFLICFLASSALAIDDPFNIFCGSQDCYEILGLKSKENDQKAIKKAYRKLALSLHPDKNPDTDTTEAFRQVAKAMEVLGDTEQKELYDYYLSHPREYYKVTGKYYYKQLPKADVRVIIAVLVLFLSVLLPVVQYQKWKRAKDFVKYAAANNLGLVNGGTKETMEVYRRAALLYEQQAGGSGGVKGSSKGGPVKPTKMMKDPEFLKIVEQIVDEVEVEGGYRKPSYRDVFLVKLVLFPFDLVQWSRKKYRYAYHSHEMSVEEKDQAAAETVGMATWEAISDSDKDFLVDRSVWNNSGALQELMQLKQEEALAKRPGMKKRYQRYMKNRGNS